MKIGEEVDLKKTVFRCRLCYNRPMAEALLFIVSHLTIPLIGILGFHLLSRKRRELRWEAFILHIGGVMIYIHDRERHIYRMRYETEFFEEGDNNV